MDGTASLLTVAIVAAVLVIRAALAELRDPGSARARWAFVSNPRAMTAGAVTAVVLGLVGRQHAGPGAVAWAVLAGALVAVVVDRHPPAG
ncbi:hypothetical protein AB0K47_07955 [Streptomyces tirandamycinicus]|uniref:Uncharacterized protein n=1 Tax=Streptomyces tirandamycinicus TaxID=2174846 RepID=A0A2S1SZE4_9ACTN|nr:MULTISPECIES: hypothetical protein [Streptomyces]AWI31789.1 hypothetical protein DDW44_25620 [Streptomyces tirandamycinicus]TFE52891.1 hypothetical protein E3E14_11070 [Streptomyces sp. ICN441]